MNIAAFLAAPAIALLVAGCANQPAQIAEAKTCKVAPLSFASLDSYGGRPTKPVDKLEQERALLQLQSTPYYRQQLRQRGYGNNTLADATRDCY